MDKYLQEILREVNMIIIPGLGALSITNKVTGEIMFMPYLKHEDKTLAKYIAEKEGWSENEASNLISKYVREIEAKLNSGDSYDMFNFGAFSKDSSGDVIFVQSVEEEKKPVEEKETVEEVQTKETLVSESNVVDQTDEVKQEDIIDDEEIVQVEYVPEMDSDKEIPEIIDEQAAEIPEVVEESEKVEIDTQEADNESEEINNNISGGTYTEQQQWEDDLDLPPVNAKVERPKKPILEKAGKDKKKKRPVFYIMLVLFVLLISGGTIVGVFYNQIKSAIFDIKGENEDTTLLATEKQFEFTEENQNGSDKNKGEVIENTSDEEEETVATEKVEQEAEVKVEKKIENVSADDNLPFHLITGSFQNKEFADKFSAKMQSEGNSSMVIGPYDNFYLISIGSYNSQEEAKTGFKEKRASYPKAWIFRKP